LGELLRERSPHRHHRALARGIGNDRRHRLRPVDRADEHEVARALARALRLRECARAQEAAGDVDREHARERGGVDVFERVVFVAVRGGGDHRRAVHDRVGAPERLRELADRGLHRCRVEEIEPTRDEAGELFAERGDPFFAAQEGTADARAAPAELADDRTAEVTRRADDDDVHQIPPSMRSVLPW
jgi:hypothetical protein